MMGESATRLVPSLVDELLGFFDDPNREFIALQCIGQLAPARRDAFARVAAAARPRPPEIRHVEGYPQYNYDATLHRRGPAIEALGHFAPFADEAVPILIDAITTFVEYDPDWGYSNGEHGRVIDALSRLGPASAAAVPTLIPRIRVDNYEIDSRIVRFFGHLGQRAHEALPALRQLAREFELDTEPLSDPPTEQLDPLIWAIHRIEGKVK
jgi:hypothetical protein